MLPNGWRCQRLEGVAEIQTGLAIGGKQVNDPIELPYLRVANVQDGFLDLKEIKTTFVERNKVNRYMLQKGDVLLTEGGDFDKLGRGAIWNGQIPNCIHQNHVFAVRTDPQTLLPQFFSALTSSSYGKRYFLSCAKQTTNLASINSSQLKSFPVLIPPLVEQFQLIKVLSTWDEAIDLTDQLIAVKQKRKQTLMQQLLTGQVRFSEFEVKWKKVAFSDILQVSIGKTPARQESKYWDDTKISQNVWLSIADLKQKYISNSKEYISDLGIKKCNCKCYQPGTVLMSFKLTIGKAAILQVPAYTNEAICALIPKKDNLLNNEFLYYALSNVNFDREIDQAVKGKTLNLEKLKRLELSLPGYDEQVRIAEVIIFVDKELDLLQQKLAALRQQKQGLMQQLLTGKIRVKV